MAWTGMVNNPISVLCWLSVTNVNRISLVGNSGDNDSFFYPSEILTSICIGLRKRFFVDEFSKRFFLQTCYLLYNNEYDGCRGCECFQNNPHFIFFMNSKRRSSCHRCSNGSSVIRTKLKPTSREQQLHFHKIRLCHLATQIFAV